MRFCIIAPLLESISESLDYQLRAVKLKSFLAAILECTCRNSQHSRMHYDSQCVWYNLTALSLSFLCVLCWLLQLAADVRVCLSAPAIIGAPHATTAHHQHALGESPRTPRQRVSADRPVSRTPTSQRTPHPTAVRILAHAAQRSSAETPHWPSAAVLCVVRVRGWWDVCDGCGLVLVIAQPLQAASRASHSARPATHNGAYQTNKLSSPPPPSHHPLLSTCRLHHSTSTTLLLRCHWLSKSFPVSYLKQALSLVPCVVCYSSTWFLSPSVRSPRFSCGCSLPRYLSYRWPSTLSVSDVFLSSVLCCYCDALVFCVAMILSVRTLGY
jgi:hypothetical protein